MYRPDWSIVQGPPYFELGPCTSARDSDDDGIERQAIRAPLMKATTAPSREEDVQCHHWVAYARPKFPRHGFRYLANNPEYVAQNEELEGTY